MKYLLGLHRNYGHKHLFERYASVLECIAIVLYVVVVVIRVGEEVILFREDEFVREVVMGQSYTCRIFDLEYFFRVVVEVLTYFVSEVGIGTSVPDHFDGILHLNSTMVSGQYHFITHFGNAAEEIVGRALLPLTSFKGTQMSAFSHRSESVV